MPQQVKSWKHFFIHPNDEHYANECHIVGRSPFLPLLEVAVPVDTPPLLPYQAMPLVPRVSIDLLVTPEETNEKGYEAAFRKHQDMFLERAKQGIWRFGTGLGDWYRLRYPNLRSRIEYLILLYDLPSKSPSSAPAMKVLNMFVESALILAFSVMRPHEEVSQDLQKLNPRAILERLRESIEHRLSKDHICPVQEQEIASRVRFVLVYAGGPSNQVQMEALGQKTENIDISLTFRLLLKGESTSRQHAHPDDITRQVESARAFHGCSEVRRRIDELSAQMDIYSSLRINCLPGSWITSLSGPDRGSFQGLVREFSALFGKALNPGKIKQIYVIWSYTRLRGCWVGIRQHANELFHEVAKNLLDGCTKPAELVIDVMTMFCLTMMVRIVSETHKPLWDVLERFDHVVRRGYVGEDSICLWRCLSSIRRVLSAVDFPAKNQTLVNFINQLKLQDLMAEGSEFAIDNYWNCRLRCQTSHERSISYSRQRGGHLTVELPPLKLPEELTIDVPGQVEDCIRVNTNSFQTSVKRARGTLAERRRRKNESQRPKARLTRNRSANH